MLGFKNFYYIIKIKSMLDIVKLNFFIKKASNINTYFRALIIKGNSVKNLIKKVLLIIKIDFKFKISTINKIL